MLWLSRTGQLELALQQLLKTKEEHLSLTSFDLTTAQHSSISVLPATPSPLNPNIHSMFYFLVCSLCTLFPAGQTNVCHYFI